MCIAGSLARCLGAHRGEVHDDVDAVDEIPDRGRVAQVNEPGVHAVELSQPLQHGLATRVRCHDFGPRVLGEQLDHMRAHEPTGSGDEDPPPLPVRRDGGQLHVSSGRGSRSADRGDA